ncbi:MAG TPA: rhodanese-like domain-containing protein [Hydrogenophaga sp.]|uniref:rhodanese-like domain-containing protein n=1 Tax=Hydrogenophaga sp. TaxID=1904254 RepID=UPI002B7EC20E|nr:rhodanese-like domain-containing protein [Hydrogenophaga sp.]HMN93906.1 rhodanese-like domain-containing protein [Hydrogenophaga sp.]HMP11508.1 rhodanese-like domain-containing protein [Hydrogenophaga sp.]
MTPTPLPAAPGTGRRRLIGSVSCLIVAGVLPVALTACSQRPDPLRVELAEGRALFEAKQVLMFDIRESSEHATGVANGARLLPMSQLQKRLGEIPRDPQQPVLIICNTQNRSSKVVQAMKEAGWDNVRYVHGGMSAWARNGWPMVRPFGLTPS